MGKRKTQLGIVALLFAILIILVPISIVIIAPIDSPPEYSFEGRLIQNLGSSQEGKLQYHLVESVGGDPPAEQFVVLIDKSFTRQTAQVSLAIGEELWMQGDVMTQSSFFGKQYQFFGEPQIYVSQMKQGSFWPDQRRRLIALYWAPLASLMAPLFLLLWVLQIVTSGGSDANGFGLILSTGLLLITIFAGLKYRRHKPVLVLILLGYALVAIILKVPSL